jgi:hypothetical protein
VSGRDATVKSIEGGGGGGATPNSNDETGKLPNLKVKPTKSNNISSPLPLSHNNGNVPSPSPPAQNIKKTNTTSSSPQGSRTSSVSGSSPISSGNASPSSPTLQPVATVSKSVKKNPVSVSPTLQNPTLNENSSNQVGKAVSNPQKVAKTSPPVIREKATSNPPSGKAVTPVAPSPPANVNQATSAGNLKKPVSQEKVLNPSIVKK